MRFINLTLHEIHEITTGLLLAPSSRPARLEMATNVVTTVDSIPIIRSEFVGTLQHLPEPREGIMYVVSALALNGVPNTRTDVVAPGDAVRDKAGKVIACRGFRLK